MNTTKQGAPDRPATGSMKLRFAVPSEYRPLHKYLAERFADIVVLRFTEIESLIGFTLPAAARLDPAWWATVDAAGAPVPQSHSWTQADRTAVANLAARSVTFERAAP